jgi:hypothetical protein
MSSVSLAGVQKLLHLDIPYPQFPSYVQHFQFLVEGVLVKAVANVRWRSISIYITEPFEILAWDCQPPLFALGVMMVKRREILASKGMSDLDDFIEHTKTAYVRHVTYLRLKREIDAAQAPVLKKHRDELQRLHSVYESIRLRVATEKSGLRQQFKKNSIPQKSYQEQMKTLKKEEFDARCAHSNLERKIEMKLEEIKTKMVDQALSIKGPST